MQIKKGSTSQIILVFAQDTTSVTGAGKTGLLWNTSGLIAYYMRNAASAAVAITLQTMTLGTWVSGGFIEVDSVHLPGLYALGVPDAALITGTDGSSGVILQLTGASGVLFAPTRLDLVAYDPQNATTLGLTNLDAAVSSRSTYAGGAVASVTADVGITQAAADKVWLSAVRTLTSFGTLVADTASAVWDKLTSVLTTAGSIGKLLVDNINATISSRAAASTALTNATWTDARAAKLDDLDATISSRLATSGYTTPPTAGAIADQVWDETASDHNTAGSTGAELGLEASAATIADAVWDEALADHQAAGSTGAELGLEASADTIAEAVWDVTLSDHIASGSTGGKINQIGSASVTIVSPVVENGDVTIEQGDDYLSADNRALQWTLTGAPDLSGGTITFKRAGLTKEGSASGSVVTVELTAAETAEMGAGVVPYELQAELANGHIVSLVRGNLTITRDY